MIDRDQITIAAARRLLRSRLRQYLLHKEQVYLRERNQDECLDLSVDSEKMIEAASEATWITTLSLWGTGEFKAPVRQVLETLIQNALNSAVEESQDYIIRRGVECGHADTGSWVLEFVSEFNPKSLLGEVKPCASET
jgi:hypothetical protein